MTKKKSKTPFILSSIFLAIAILSGYLFYLWYFEWRFIISTNDAYVEGDVATIAPKVNGYVEKLLANENTYVKKGDLLFELNPSDYDIALKHAQIQVDIQKRALITIDAQMKAAQANLSGATAQIQAAKAALINAQNSFNRLKKLESRDFVSKSQIDNATLQVNKARADLTSAQSQELAAKENLNVLAAKKQEVESQIKALQVLCYKAQKDINDTVIKAPFDGVISNIVAKKGDLVSSGKPLASLIPVKNLYVVANYKETQVKDIEPGTIATITADAYKKHSFKGRVSSIAPATGAVFSLLPPQNATGNFTKVVQRIPVKIALPNMILNSGILRAGMSVTVDIDTRQHADSDD